MKQIAASELLQTPAITASAAATASQAALSVAPPEPTAGGNYVRDPITGALSVNPAFQETQE
jgi:hypothetical protein